MTEQQLNDFASMPANKQRLVMAIEARFKELGFDSGHVFGRGELTHCFMDEGYVAISCPSQSNRSFLYSPTRLARVAFLECLNLKGWWPE